MCVCVSVEKWVKSTQASAFQLFPSRLDVHTSSGLIRALGSLQQSFKRLYVGGQSGMAVLPPGVSEPAGSYLPEGPSEGILHFLQSVIQIKNK